MAVRPFSCHGDYKNVASSIGGYKNVIIQIVAAKLLRAKLRNNNNLKILNSMAR